MTADGRLPRELLSLAYALMPGAVVVGLDATMVNVALETLARDFGTSLATIQWVATAYLLALAMVVPLSGWAVERYGARATWTVAIAVFTLGSALCGVAWSAGSLIAFRVVQGLGGGMIVPVMQTILARAAGPARLQRVMAAIGVPAMLAPVLGPALGGLLVSHATWRLIFYINVPICLGALALSRRVPMPETRTPTGSRLDLLGLALLSPALTGLVYGLSQAGTNGTFADRGVVVPVVIALGLLVAFLVHAHARRDAIIDVRLFRARSFAGSLGVIFFFSMAMLGSALLLPLYYQQVRGEDALHAGLLLAPQGVGFGIALVSAAKLSDRLGPRPLVLAGLAFTAASTFALTRLGEDTSYVYVSAATLISGLGIGSALVPAMAGAYRDLEQTAIARATSSLRILQQLGGSFGVAVLAVVLQQQLVDHGAGGLANAFAHTYWWALGFTVAALLPALVLPRRPVGEGSVPMKPAITTTAVTK